jgi:hypothetical protein
MEGVLDTARGSLKDLYAEAFSRFGIACLWSKKPVRVPTVQHARIIADALRLEGGCEAYVLAREIDEACDAADRPAA